MEIVYNGYDNPNRVRISVLESGLKLPMDLSGATSVVLELPDIPQTISTGIDFSIGDGIVEMSLGDAGIPVGNHRARLVAIDPLHPDGQVLVHEDIHRFRLKVV